jgi:hypothetical protein
MLSRLRIGLFQHALAHPEANGELESIEAKFRQQTLHGHDRQ